MQFLDHGGDGGDDVHPAELQLHDAGVDGGEVKDVVDDGEQRRARRHDVAGVLALLVVERADVGVAQELGEADDVGERRAQLVGNVVDEGVLERVGGDQRLVALDQRALDLDSVGDVDEGDHGLAVGQRHGGVVDDAAVGTLHAAGDRAAVLVDAGDRGGETPPDGLVVVRAPAGGDDLGDVWPLTRRPSSSDQMAANDGLCRRSRPSEPNTATPSLRWSRVAPWTLTSAL